ncbi:extensin-like [Syzygium oleosum]|uniref:extensin-like n=1 Tax=Syzygium oleosum TaxID=219896 RepID=UPI0024BA823A|nr:extensin-like [Syzygium oleosum]
MGGGQRRWVAAGGGHRRRLTSGRRVGGGWAAAFLLHFRRQWLRKPPVKSGRPVAAAGSRDPLRLLLRPPASRLRSPPSSLRLPPLASASSPQPRGLRPLTFCLRPPASASSPPPCGLLLNHVAFALPRLSSRLRLRQPRGLRLRPPTFRLRPPASASFSTLPLVASPSRPPPRRLSLAASASALSPPSFCLRLSLVASAGEKLPSPSRFHLPNQSNFFLLVLRQIIVGGLCNELKIILRNAGSIRLKMWTQSILERHQAKMKNWQS